MSRLICASLTIILGQAAPGGTVCLGTVFFALFGNIFIENWDVLVQNINWKILFINSTLKESSIIY